MFSSKLSWSVLGFLYFAVVPCRADFVNAMLNSVTDASTVTINLGDGKTSSYFSYAFAGYVNWTQQGTSINPMLGKTFSTFCIELTQDVNFGGVYNFTVTSLENAPKPGSDQSGGSSGMGTAKADAIRGLWAGYYNSIGTNATNAAAFQLAIWKIEYDWGSASYDNFAAGNFLAKDNTAVTTLAKTLVDRVKSGTYSTKATNLVALSGSSFQDQITQTLPAPPAWCMALCGGVILLAARRFGIAKSAFALHPRGGCGV
jgi:hypothetical protein